MRVFSAIALLLALTCAARAGYYADQARYQLDVAEQRLGDAEYELSIAIAARDELATRQADTQTNLSAAQDHLQQLSRELAALESSHEYRLRLGAIRSAEDRLDGFFSTLDVSTFLSNWFMSMPVLPPDPLISQAIDDHKRAVSELERMRGGLDSALEQARGEVEALQERISQLASELDSAERGVQFAASQAAQARQDRNLAYGDWLDACRRETVVIVPEPWPYYYGSYRTHTYRTNRHHDDGDRGHHDRDDHDRNDRHRDDDGDRGDRHKAEPRMIPEREHSFRDGNGQEQKRHERDGDGGDTRRAQSRRAEPSPERERAERQPDRESRRVEAHPERKSRDNDRHEDRGKRYERD